MAKYTVRPPFAVHLEWFEIQRQGTAERKVKREQSYFYGTDAIELKDADAIAHMHKLEPVDDDAKALFSEIQDKQEAARAARQSSDGNTKSMAAQIAEAVTGALLAAGLIGKGKQDKTAPAA